VSFSLIGVEKAEGMEVVNEESTDAVGQKVIGLCQL
jgi:hypothetical protein